MAIKEASELLKLLDQRYKELGLEHAKAFKVPQSPDLSAINAVAMLHAEANASDPFAFGRMRLHLCRGLDTLGDVKAAATRVLAARGSR